MEDAQSYLCLMCGLDFQEHPWYMLQMAFQNDYTTLQSVTVSVSLFQCVKRWILEKIVKVRQKYSHLYLVDR